MSRENSTHDGGMSFIIDSGASSHMCHDHSFFSTYKKLNPPKKIWVADNHTIEAIGISNIEAEAH